MTNIINKLYYGKICPSEKPAPNTKRYSENRDTIYDTEEILLKIYPDFKELLDKDTEPLRIEAQLESESDFAMGFIIGARIVAKIFKDTDL